MPLAMLRGGASTVRFGSLGESLTLVGGIGIGLELVARAATSEQLGHSLRLLAATAPRHLTAAGEPLRAWSLLGAGGGWASPEEEALFWRALSALLAARGGLITPATVRGPIAGLASSSPLALDELLLERPLWEGGTDGVQVAMMEAAMVIIAHMSIYGNNH